MTWFRGCSLLFLVVSVARADDPPKPTPKPAPVAAVVVTPATTVAPGTAVTIDASASQADDTQVVSTIDPAIFKVGPTDKIKYLFTIEPGTYFVLIDAASIIDGNLKRNQKPVSIVVQALTPVPTPAPNPVSVVVTPPATSDPLGFTASTRTVLTKSTWSGPALAFRQTTLASVFDVNSKVVATSPATLQTIVDAIGLGLSSACGSTWSWYQSNVVGPIQANIAAAIANGKIRTTADMAEVFTEIATALRGN